MKLATLVIALLMTTTPSARAADPVEEVRQAEIAFAKAFADRDAHRFFSMVAKDATFLGAGHTLRGKQQVMDRWSRFFQGGTHAPFEWGPERVEVTSDGKLGLSSGPIYLPNGEHAGYYSSIWQKQSDGSWLVIFDGPGSAPAPPAKVEEGWITADDGLKLYYRKTGQGPQTLIIPFDFTFHEPFKQFSDTATVITYDPRNRGRSERSKDKSTWTIQQDVKDLEAVRRELKVERFVPIGWSYLGNMIVQYALAHPERVTRIIQLGPGQFRPHDYANTAPPPNVPEADRARAAASNTCEAQWSVYRHTLTNRPEKFDLSFCAHPNEHRAQLFEHLGVLLPTFQSTDLTDQLKNVRASALIIHGTHDRNAPYQIGVDWAKALPDARLVTIPAAAHAIWLDDPVTTFGSIRQFLRGEWPLGAGKM